jgi:hypothetical protein
MEQVEASRLRQHALFEALAYRSSLDYYCPGQAYD